MFACVSHSALICEAAFVVVHKITDLSPKLSAQNRNAVTTLRPTLVRFRPLDDTNRLMTTPMSALLLLHEL